ncbi:MAG: deoxyguanosinetriphosphate triphosphohydrolase [Eubacterium sp.]|nr:deoxyguanosinetriphosphate triphosphohydrolase [Eubacterium sp.]
MDIREIMEEKEQTELSPFASLARNSRGRAREEEPCDVRTAYQRDRDRILHSKAFRRLKDKTQVFLSPQGDHYRTRLTHTLEVSQIARTVAKALQLNVDLVEAISLGHDLGHTPFGHAGEKVLNQLCPAGFRHNQQSLRVVELLEKDGKGLNLTWEVRDGILNHQTSGNPSTLEGQIVRICDKIAYIHHDMDDAQRAGIITEEDIPKDLREALGMTTRARLNTLIHDLIASSYGKSEIRQSEEVAGYLARLREVMFEDVYTNPVAKQEEEKVVLLFGELYHYYESRPEALPEKYRQLIDSGEQEAVVICDYISGMTDQYCIRTFEGIFVPNAWDVL